MIGRPERGEAGEFHFGYIDQVMGNDVVGVLERQLAEYQELLGGVSEERSHSRYAPGKWTIRESLGHVVDTERIFAYRALWFARKLGGELASFDQDLAVANGGADEVQLSEHLEEFDKVRRSTLSFFQNLAEDAWMQTGIAAGTKFTVRGLAFVIAGHAEHHLKIFKSKYF